MKLHFDRNRPLAPPLYHSAVYQLPDLDTVDAIYEGQADGFIYARDGHPNAMLLADELARAERGKWGLVTSTGMAALAAPLLALARPGDSLLASDQLYGKTTKLLQAELARWGIETRFVDSNNLQMVEECLGTTPTKFVLVETISNPFCRVADIPRLAELCQRHGARLLVDNTFATPVLCRPLEWGADLVMESLTKMINGHSDVTLGFVSGRDGQVYHALAGTISTFGMSASPTDCWLAQRGAATLALRMRAASANASRLATWLRDQPGVVRVIYPGLEDHPDSHLVQRLLTDGPGNMLCFELENRDTVNCWMRAAQIPFCPSLGHHETTCSHPDTTSHRFVPTDRKRAMGITPGLVRLSVGCEPYEQLMAAMTPQAFVAS